jgi:methylthioribulose-1-phosphate dehydratase
MDPAVARETLIQAGRWLDARGYCPATSGNYSLRLDDRSLLVTASGKHKGKLGPADFVVTDMEGRPLDGATPSAETPLHATMFGLDPSIGAVIHTHSVASTVLGLVLKGERQLVIEGYEMQKALPGVSDHETAVPLPIFENSQDMARLARDVREHWQRGAFPGYILRGHGLYTWGVDLGAALTAVEALEFLLTCEFERRKVPR